jgi:mRNA interferase HigB
MRAYSQIESAGRESESVHIITKARLDEYGKKHADARGSLFTWWKTVERAQWSHIQEVRNTYSAADYDPDTELTIFNIKGNRYRLRVRIDYDRQLVFIHDFMTHATYDKRK